MWLSPGWPIFLVRSGASSEVTSPPTGWPAACCLRGPPSRDAKPRSTSQEPGRSQREETWRLPGRLSFRTRGVTPWLGLTPEEGTSELCSRAHRALIVAVEHFSGETLKFSTKQHLRESGRNAAKGVTLRAFAPYRVGEEPLLAYLQRSPARDCDPCGWRKHLQHVLPCLDVWMAAFRSRAIRRAHFQVHMRRDRSLDGVCRRLCAMGNVGFLKQPLIAFGDASTVSTGFGYAPAPQARRLRTMHKALVTVIHEFRTSVMCHRCHGLLEKCFHRGAARTTARPIHGIMSCPRCLNRSGARQFWHRDVNAARNIFAIYLSLAVSGQRPSYLRRAE